MPEEENGLQKLLYKTTNSTIIHMTSIYFKLTMIQFLSLFSTHIHSPANSLG